MSANRVHRDEARRVVYGVVTILSLLAVGVVGAIVQTGGALPGKHYTYVRATFDDVGILKTGKEVKQDGLPVGQVSDIEYRDGRAEVTLRLDGDQDVYRDATAFVGNSSALGKKFVGFDPGTAEAGRLGDAAIPPSQTGDSASLEDVLSTFDPETRAALRTSLGALANGVGGHSRDLGTLLAHSPSLLTDLRTLTGAAADPDTDLDGLLASADRLAGRFQGREAQIASLLHNVDATMAGLGVDGGEPLEAAVGELPATLTEARGALDELESPLVDARSALRTLRPGGRALGAATPHLRGFLRHATGPLDKVPAVSRQAGPAVADLTATLADARPLVAPLSAAVGSLDRLLFPFAPYAGDAGHFFAQHDLLSGTLGSDDKHYFAAMLTGVGLFSVDGIPDPLYRSEPYPIPGTAWNHATVTDSRTHGGGR